MRACVRVYPLTKPPEKPSSQDPQKLSLLGWCVRCLLPAACLLAAWSLSHLGGASGVAARLLVAVLTFAVLLLLPPPTACRQGWFWSSWARTGWAGHGGVIWVGQGSAELAGVEQGCFFALPFAPEVRRLESVKQLIKQLSSSKVGHRFIDIDVDVGDTPRDGLQDSCVTRSSLVFRANLVPSSLSTALSD